MRHRALSTYMQYQHIVLHGNSFHVCFVFGHALLVLLILINQPVTLSVWQNRKTFFLGGPTVERVHEPHRACTKT